MSAPLAPKFRVYQSSGKWHMASRWQGSVHTRQLTAKTRDDAEATARR